MLEQRAHLLKLSLLPNCPPRREQHFKCPLTLYTRILFPPCLGFLTDANLIGEKWYIIIIFNLHFFLGNRASFISLRAIYEWSVIYYLPFILQLVVFFLLIYRCSLYIRKVCPVAVMHVTLISTICHYSFEFIFPCTVLIFIKSDFKSFILQLIGHI